MLSIMEAVSGAMYAGAEAGAPERKLCMLTRDVEPLSNSDISDTFMPS